MDEDYISAESVYDRTQGKKQSEINASVNNLDFLKSASITVTTNSNGNCEIYSSSGRVPVCAKCASTDSDVIILPFRARNGSVWAKALNWKFQPVANTQFTITWWYFQF